MTWRTKQEAFKQWCPFCVIHQIELVEVECCHPSGAPPQKRQEAVILPINRIFSEDGTIQVGDDLGQGYSAISCLGELCADWEKSEKTPPEGEEPLGRCAYPPWSGHQQRRT